MFWQGLVSVNVEEIAIIYEDVRKTALLLATRGVEGIGDFPLLQDGVKRLGSFIFESKYFIEDAIVDSAKAAYAVTCVEKGIAEVRKFSLSELTPNMNIGKSLPMKLNKLKKSRPEAFYYWYLLDNILSE